MDLNTGTGRVRASGQDGKEERLEERVLQCLEGLGHAQQRMEQELLAIHRDLLGLHEALRPSSHAAAPMRICHKNSADSTHTTHTLRRQRMVTNLGSYMEREYSHMQRERSHTHFMDFPHDVEIEKGSHRPPPSKSLVPCDWSDWRPPAVVNTFTGDASRSENGLFSSDVAPLGSNASASIPMQRTSGPDLHTVVVPPSLPTDWPKSVESKPICAGDARISTCESHCTGESIRAVPDLLKIYSVSQEMQRGEEEPVKRWTVDPSSNGSVLYGGLTLLVLIHDAFMVPWALAWEVQLEGAVLFLTCLSCCFWTVDTFVGFFVGYYHNQTLELRLSMTALRYIRTWFLPNLCVVITDWFSIFPNLISDTPVPTSLASRMLRFVKAGKLLRLAGLLRMTKLVKIFEDYIESSLSEPSRLALRLIQFLLGILWMCHALSCVWYRVGLLHSDTNMKWVYTEITQGEVVLPYMESSLVHQYVTALHWSLAQVSLGATEITCYNSAERIFNCACILMGLIGGSTLVSSLSATMVDYQALRKEETDKLVKLRRYLRENRKSVNKSTALMVQQQSAERLKLNDRVQERDVHVLELVSAGLRKQLRFEIFQPMLCCHGLFNLWVLLDRNTVQRVCLEVLEYRHFRPLDDVFFANTRTDLAYHLSLGSLQYIKDPECAPVREREVIDVPPGTWMSEASLWSAWTHVGTARAQSTCEILILPANGVSLMLQHRPEVRSLTMHYAARYHQHIIHSFPPDSMYPDDLQVPHTHFEEMVTSLPPDLLKTVSIQVISQAAGTGLHNRLRQDVKGGRSCVIMQPDGSLERTVCWVVLRLQDSKRRLLVEIGKFVGESWQPTCELPKKQVEPGEQSKITLRRLMSKVGVEEACLIKSGHERTVDLKHTPEFGVTTKTVQQTHWAVLPEYAGNALVALSCVVPVLHRRRSSIRDFKDFAFKETETQNTEDGLLRELLTEVLLDHKKRHMYAWLQPSVFDHLHSSSGERELKSWINALDLEAVSTSCGLDGPLHETVTGEALACEDEPEDEERPRVAL